MVGAHDVMTQLMRDLLKVFYMSPYEEVTEEHDVTFCGFEIAKRGGACTLHQER